MIVKEKMDISIKNGDKKIQRKSEELKENIKKLTPMLSWGAI